MYLRPMYLNYLFECTLEFEQSQNVNLLQWKSNNSTVMPHRFFLMHDRNYHWTKIKIWFLTGKLLLRKSWKQIYQTDCEGWKGHLRATWPLERLSFWYASALHFFSTLVLRFLVGCLVIVQELEVSIIKVQEFWEDHNF